MSHVNMLQDKVEHRQPEAIRLIDKLIIRTCAHTQALKACFVCGGWWVFKDDCGGCFY